MSISLKRLREASLEATGLEGSEPSLRITSPLDQTPAVVAEGKAADITADTTEAIIERIAELYVYDHSQQADLELLPIEQLAYVEADLNQWAEMPEEYRSLRLPKQTLTEAYIAYSRTPDGCLRLATLLLEELSQCKLAADSAGMESVGNKLSAVLNNGGLMCDPPDQEPSDVPQVELADSKQVPKIDLQWLYDEAPPHIKRVIKLLYVIGGRRKELAPILVLFSYNLASNLMGKEIVGLNMGRAYYGNTAFVALMESGANKFFVETVRQALDSVIYQLRRSLPRIATDIDTEDDAAVREQLRREHGLDTGVTTRLLSSAGNLNGVYKLMGAIITPHKLGSMTPAERDRMIEEMKSEMYLSSGAIILADEATMSLSKLISAGASKSSLDMGEVLKLFDSGVIFDKAVGMHGWQAVNDACVGLLGCTQPSTWNQFIGDIGDADTTGLIGRIQVVNMNDCLPVKIDRMQLPQLEASAQLETAIYDMIKHVTYAKIDDGKIVCDFEASDGPDSDWAGELYLEVAKEMGPQYVDLVDRYSFESEAGCRGKVFWHSIKLTMTHCFYSLKPSQIGAIRSKSTEIIRADPTVSPKDALIHQRKHRKYVTDMLRDSVLFKKYVMLIIGLMEANLMNLDTDMEYTKLQRTIVKHISNLGKKATVQNLRKKSIRIKRGNSSMRMAMKELKEELVEMQQAGMIGSQVMDSGSGGDIVYFPLKKVREIQ